MIQISESEQKIMEVLWTHSPLTSKQILQKLDPISQWHENTVRTLLSRLVKKNALTQQKVKREYFYTPALSREQFVSQESSSLLSRLFDGNISPLIANFAKQDMLSDEDIRQIEDILQSLKKGDIN